MIPLTLSPSERQQLCHFILHAPCGKLCCRAQALLEFDQGESVEAIADRCMVTRQTVYNWLRRFRQRSEQNFWARLQDSPREGRPPTALGIIDPLLEEVIDTDPRCHGYRHTVWTAALLQHYLRQIHSIVVSRKSVSLAIARLGIRWKRPRHVLKQRQITWRQAKGG